MRYSLARTCLALAAGTAAAGLIQVIVWPRWPQAAAVGLDRLRLGGAVIPGRVLLPATREASLAQSALVEFPLPAPRPSATQGSQGGAAGPAPIRLRLRLIEPRNWRSFQVAEITKGIAALDVDQRTLKVRGEDELATGLIKGQSALQTCLTDGGFGVVTQAKFFPLSFEKPSQGPIQQLDRFLGLRQNRENRCLLVTLLTQADRGPRKMMGHGTINTPGSARLVEAWSQVRPALSNTLAMGKKPQPGLFR